jgi:hypothetical protein
MKSYELDRVRSECLLLRFFDSQLVNPVNDKITLFHNALPVAGDAGDKFLFRHEKAGIDAFFLGPEQKRLYAVTTVFHPLDETEVQQFFNDAGALSAVDIQLLPELALQHSSRGALDEAQGFFFQRCHNSEDG